MRNKFYIPLLAIIFAFILIAVYLIVPSSKTPHKLSYLALGDSYTIGYKVRYADNYPRQTTDILRAQHLDLAIPLIVAYPGWTSNDLARALDQRNITDTFSFVTLLIGTNDLFQGWALPAYKTNFELLLSRAIAFTAGHPQRVFVLSIPDVSLTRFAHGKDKTRIANSINGYNEANKQITLAHQCRYIDITLALSTHASDPSYYIPDWVHPTAKGYTIWAHQMAPVIANALKQ